MAGKELNRQPAVPIQRNIVNVGLAGPSGRGKSTVAKRVATRLNGHVISMENYSPEMNHLPLKERAELDYDAPNAIDVNLREPYPRSCLRQCHRDSHLRLCEALACERPVQRYEHIPARTLLIVEGILALHFAQLRALFHLSIYPEAPQEICFHRRKMRDITERQRSLEFILSRYKNNVLPATQQYVLPSKRYADLVLQGIAALPAVEKSVYDAIVERHVLGAMR